MQKTLTDWLASKKITLAQAQVLSQIIEPDQVYPLAELQLLAQLPPTPTLKKAQTTANQWILESYWKANWKWLLPLLLIILLYLLKC